MTISLGLQQAQLQHNTKNRQTGENYTLLRCRGELV